MFFIEIDVSIQKISPIKTDANWKKAADMLFVKLIFIEHLMQNI